MKSIIKEGLTNISNLSNGIILIETRYGKLRYIKKNNEKILQQQITEVYFNGDFKQNWKTIEIEEEGEETDV